MSIITKFTLKNIKEKKSRTFLILISIILSTALFFASTAISTTLEQMILLQMKQFTGSADITATAGEKTAPYFSPKVLDSFTEHIEHIVGVNEGMGQFKYKDESINMALQGIDLDDLQKLNPISLKEEKNLYPFKGDKVIIGQLTADKYNLKVGDVMSINMNGFIKRFIISGISEAMGPFASDSMMTYIIVPRDTIAAFAKAKGRVSSLSITLDNSEYQDSIIQKLSEAYPQYSFNPTIPKALLKQQTQQISMTFLVMVLFVIILSMFIIFTSFKVITAERLPIIGTFRSIGATKKMTNRVLMIESILYGIIGSVLGILLGFGILSMMIKFIVPPFLQQSIGINFTMTQLGMAFGLGVCLAFFGAYIPIKKVSKIPVKDIVLNKVEKPPMKSGRKTIIGILLLIVGIALPLSVPENLRIPFNVLGMVIFMPAIILLVPVLTKAFVNVFKQIYKIFGNEGVLAVQNLKDNKNILNNIILLGISISVVFMINIISDSLGNSLSNSLQEYNYDIQVYTYPNNRSTESRLMQIKGVDSTCGVYESRNIEIANLKDVKLNSLIGVNQDKIFDYFNFDIEGSQEQLIKKLDEQRNILITNTFKDENNIVLGQTLNLKTSDGVLPYKVIGFFNSVTDGGTFGLVGERYLKSDMNLSNYSSLYVKTNDPNIEVVAQNIREKMKRQQPYVMSKQGLEIQMKQESAQLLGIFKGFSILALIIGIFGVFNNLIISFMARKRSLAIMRSVGMNKVQIIKMILIEAVTGGIIGASVGISAGYLLVLSICHILEAVGASMANFIHITTVTVLSTILIGIVITVAASISPALKSSKLNIIEAIKYE